jgi:P-type E1-E2 ATPase
MIEISIPGRGNLQLEHLVCDVNGTLAVDGVLIEGVARLFKQLADRLTIHLLTADTHGRQTHIDLQLGLYARRITPGGEAGQKETYVRQLGAERVIAVGQGANDAGMLRAAAVGIVVFSKEGTAAEALQAADVIAPDVLTALELIDRPLRLVATLRK